MSRGWGARTGMGQKVLLNVYDLNEANEYTHEIGLGMYHSGVEINGREYTFGGGGGIFEHEPKDAPNCRFRESIEMGVFEGTSADISRALDNLKGDFGPNAYNILTKNCNHFSDAFCQELLNRPAPGYVNRLAYLGSFFACLIPPEYLGGAPTDAAAGGGGGGGGGGYEVSGGWAAQRRAAAGGGQRPRPAAGYVAGGGTLAPAGAPSGAAPPGGGGGGPGPGPGGDREAMVRQRLARFEQQQGGGGVVGAGAGR